MYHRYTKELLAEAVRHSTNFSAVLRYLGLRQAGGTLSHLAGRIRHFGIDTTHFHRQPWNTGRPSPRKLDPATLLRLGPDSNARRSKNWMLLRALREMG